jgi:hypothetical protein
MKINPKVLLVNVDSRWNMAIRKMYNYYINNNHAVDMIDLGFSGYPHKRTKQIDGTGYDSVFISNIFDINKDRVTVVNCENVQFGGIGSRNPHLQLPKEIEKTEPFYFPNEDTSYGFITRGCIRKCWFCKVPKYEGDLKAYNRIEDIVKHKKVKFLDNNILAYPEHMKVFRWCLEHPEIKVEFNQGLDFRLVNDENLDALSRLNYMGEYIFAFDEPKYQPLLEKKLRLIKKYIPKPWKLKFYIYYHPTMDLKQLFDRVEWCRERECLPYVMRDIACWDCENKNFLIDYAAYCNQPGFFKNLSFGDFLLKRVKGGSIDEERRLKDLRIYTTHNNID